MIARADSGGATVPAEYQIVEYIKSTRRQFINTMYFPNQATTTVILDVRMDGAFSNATTELGPSMRMSQAFVGAVTGPGTNEIFSINFGQNLSQGLQTYCWIGNTAVKAMNLSKDTLSSKNTLSMSRDAVKWGGSSVAIEGAESLSFEYPLFLFGSNYTARNGYSYVFGAYDMFLYSCDVLENGITVCKFVPCYRRSDKKPGLYDVVRRKFFENIGLGEFECGPEV